MLNVVYHMNMKTSPNDVSNQEILAELKNVSSRTSALETSTQDILEALHVFAGSVDDRFDRVETEISGIKAVMVTKDELKSELSRFATKEDLMSEMSKQQTRMVTKDYLDDKLSDHHSAIILHTQREIANALG